METALTIAVLLKFTVDVNQLKVIPKKLSPDFEHAQVRINEFDENAIEEAVQLKEQLGGRVMGLSLVNRFPPREVILRALAVGLDEITLILDGNADLGNSFRISCILTEAIKRIFSSREKGLPDLIICGDMSADGCSGQTGIRVAEELNIPSLSVVTRLEIRNGHVLAERTLENRIENIEAGMPVLITVNSETNQPRLPTVLQIMGAGRKPIRTIQSASLSIGLTDSCSQFRTISIAAPPNHRKQIMVHGENPIEVAENLLRYLREEGEISV
jgi:electron transfer flavoprotein beta subunit